MYDVFFLSFDEPMAERHWHVLKSNIASARRVNGVRGIHAAHIACAKASKTRAFYVVDADNELTDYDFSYKIPSWDLKFTHLWSARNPVNGLVYGWGGVKLFPRSMVLNMEGRALDMTTSFPLKIMDSVKSITHFNYAPFETWRSAFRECVKLSLSADVDAQNRLTVWTTQAHGPFAAECLDGARAGKAFAETHRGNDEMIHKINDYDFLFKTFSGAN